ncbi:murein hydrolase activator EnvC family protein [Microbacterium sp. NPDC055903]
MFHTAPLVHRILAGLALAILLLAGQVSAHAATDEDAAHGEAAGTWLWPVGGRCTVIEPFRAPSHHYGPGHRGIDIAVGQTGVVRSPAPGVVAFRGTVVDRPLLTIDHGGGLVSTFEPLTSELSPGDVVEAGDVIGILSSGGHAAVGSLHIGVRRDGIYVDPLLLFGRPARAVLLPCCG